MALEKFGAELLALARDQGCPLERVLTLGRQNILFYESEIKKIEKVCKFKVTDIVIPNSDAGFAEEFLSRLGAQIIESIDYSDYQGSNVIHDLNAPIEEELEGKYDLVFDGGTLEHIYHFPNAICNCMRLLKVGGWFLSVTASNNWNGHGFYQFSPELFFRAFDKENGFEAKIMALGEAVQGGKVFRIEDGADLGHRVSVNGRKPLFLIFAARRESSNLPLMEKFLYQSDYSSSWDSAAEKGKEVPLPAIAGGKRFRIRGVVPTWVKSVLRPIVKRVSSSRARRASDGLGFSRVSGLSDCLRSSQ